MRAMLTPGQPDHPLIRKLCRRWLYYSIPLNGAISALLHLAIVRNGHELDLHIMTILMATALQLMSEISLLSHLLHKLQTALPRLTAQVPQQPKDLPTQH